MAVEHRLQTGAATSVMAGTMARLGKMPGGKARFLLGRAAEGDAYPIWMPEEYLDNHMWVCGPTRSGKTARAITPLAAQIIASNRGPVIIGDMRGDIVLFQTIKHLCEQAGHPFLYFTNVPYFSTHLFNPVAQSVFDRVTLPQFVQYNCVALGMHHGSGYGREWFSALSRGALLQALGMPLESESEFGAWGPTTKQPFSRVSSFGEALDRLQRLMADKVHRQTYGGAHHLLIVLKELARTLQLDFGQDGKRFPQAAIDNAIDTNRILNPAENGKFPVVYFYLQPLTDVAIVSQIMKLFIYSMYTSLVQRGNLHLIGEAAAPPKVTLFLDEWQCLGDPLFGNILSQCSGPGLRLVLANQDSDQLKNADTNLQASVFQNCGNKCIFGCRDVELQDMLIKLSGEKTIHVPSYQVSHDALKAGQVSSDYALKTLNGQMVGVSISEQRGPRFDRNALCEMSNKPGRCIYVPPQGIEGADYGGYPIMVDTDFFISKQEFERLSSARWPEPTAKTIVPEKYQGVMGK